MALLALAISPVFRSQMWLCASCHSVTHRICQKQPPPIIASVQQSDANYCDSSCQALPATTCLFWSLPLQHSDSERWGTMWLGRHCAMETSSTDSRSRSQLGALQAGHSPAWNSMSGFGKSELRRAWGRFGRLANCRPKSVTLGDGGIKACWLGFTGGAKLTLSFPRADSSWSPLELAGGSGSH